MTFSIVAGSTDGAAWGVAVASKFLAVGAVVPAAAADVGAIATQAYANTTFKSRGLALLGAGTDAEATLHTLLGDDPGRHDRQLGIVDAVGKAATFTGSACYPWAGGLTDEGVAIQGNILTGPEVVEAMHRAWLATDPAESLGQRLCAALAAGDQAGGDSRGRQSAALLVVSEGAGYAGFDDVAVDLRVDDHPDPVTEMGRLLAMHDLYFGEPAAEDRVARDEALQGEVDDLARALGRPDFDAWVATENYENRVTTDWIDRRVVEILRGKAG